MNMPPRSHRPVPSVPFRAENSEVPHFSNAVYTCGWRRGGVEMERRRHSRPRWSGHTEPPKIIELCCY